MPFKVSVALISRLLSTIVAKVRSALFARRFVCARPGGGGDRCISSGGARGCRPSERTARQCHGDVTRSNTRSNVVRFANTYTVHTVHI